MVEEHEMVSLPKRDVPNRVVPQEVDKIEVIPEPLKPEQIPNEELTDLLKSSKKLTVYFNKRWLMMTLVVLINFANTISWIAYAPVANYVNSYYGDQTAHWLSLVYMFVAVPTSFVAICAGSNYGISGIFMFASIPTFVGSLIRWLSSIPAADQSFRSHIAITGQVLAGISFPFIMYLPSKVSNAWFPPSQRTIATTIGVMSNPAGVMVANLVSPLLVQSSTDVWFLNATLFGVCSISLAAALLGISGSLSKGNKRTDLKTKSYDESIRKCLKTPTYIIVFFTLGGGIGMFNCLYAKMSSLMCPAGHGNGFSGFCAAVMIGVGIIGAMIASYLVDKYKWYKQVMIVSMIGASASGIGFIWLTRVSELFGAAGLLACAALLGAFGLAAYPVGLELAVECTYPIATEVSSGFIVIVGQVYSVIFTIILDYFSHPLSIEDVESSMQVCRASVHDSANSPKDYLVGLIIMTVIAVLLAVPNLFIKPDYVRRKSENSKRFHISKEDAEDFFDIIARANENTLINPKKPAPNPR